MSELAREALEHVAAYLNRLPFVTWDRFVGDEETLGIFGWIDRQDGRSDFVSLAFEDLDRPLPPGFSTSSAERSLQIHRLLYGDLEGVDDDDHEGCQRVEAVFGDLVERKVELGIRFGSEPLPSPGGRA